MNKTVCDTCWEKHSDIPLGPFNEVEERICCPTEFDDSIRDYPLSRKPPKHCPYKLQHAVAAGMKNAK